jgi:hypothetical protein
MFALRTSTSSYQRKNRVDLGMSAMFFVWVEARQNLGIVIVNATRESGKRPLLFSFSAITSLNPFWSHTNQDKCYYQIAVAIAETG